MRGQLGKWGPGLIGAAAQFFDLKAVLALASVCQLWLGVLRCGSCSRSRRQ